MVRTSISVSSTRTTNAPSIVAGSLCTQPSNWKIVLKVLPVLGGNVMQSGRWESPTRVETRTTSRPDDGRQEQWQSSKATLYLVNEEWVKVLRIILFCLATQQHDRERRTGPSLLVGSWDSTRLRIQCRSRRVYVTPSPLYLSPATCTNTEQPHPVTSRL